MDEDKAELIGIMLGDGSIGTYRRGDRPGLQYRAKVTLNSEKDLSYSKYVSELFHRLFGHRPRGYFRRGEKTIDLITARRSTVEKLLALGLVKSPKKGNANIPVAYRKGKLALKVLRGYMDTDGCITVFNNNGILYPRIEMKVCSSPMQQQLVDILFENGFRPRVNDIGEGSIRIMLAGEKRLERWCGIIGFSNERNSKIAKRFIRK